MKMFSDPDRMRQVMETVGTVLYERLRGQKERSGAVPCTSSQFDKKCGGLFFSAVWGTCFFLSFRHSPTCFWGCPGAGNRVIFPIKGTAGRGFRRRFGTPQIPAKNKGK